ncbi:hypothetical protein BD324DRAFT_657055 [Kockovaella imperatae]|uniref:Zn(2)-C6 fungal-type domain-containing protein n=1 Tax=Kockovaella imperatae TaxID=4999 RepID=A0A1Y1UDJ8_9TREE|nr:hypothetical protein BD324DRAFT_657055 [Kockovaella imperatae]ORX36111.1 hypothetical protein BD324DRAFT_657055 [Kockovaella imperatae]
MSYADPSTGSAMSSSSTAHKRTLSQASPDDEHAPIKAQKSARACLNCRKQKMKCDLEGDPPCKRCLKSKTPCLFKVRANGIDAGDWFISDHNVTQDEEFKQSVLTRLHIIETKLGITALPSSRSVDPSAGIRTKQEPAVSSSVSSPRPFHGEHGVHDNEKDRPLPDLWTALGILISHCSEADKRHRGWNTPIVEALWLSFAEHMPALHFSTQRIFNDRPTPLLLAAVLFAASIQHPLGEYAELSPFYHASAANAIAQLAVPSKDPGFVYSDAQDLQDALGIIVMGLLSEAWVNTTGIWISMAYQIVLSGAAKCDKAKLKEWRGLYEGLRVVDIEHASLNMAYPVLPLLCPIPSLEHITPEADTPRQAWTHLTTIMHVGLSHFSGRHIRTIMETVLVDSTRVRPPASPSSSDLRSIKGWANELDAWLMKYHKPSKFQQRGPSEANVMLLQYQLHKLFVLFIYNSVTNGARSGDSKASSDEDDLLSAARAALRIQRLGMAVWSNWDLVLITLAAFIVIDHFKMLTQPEDRLLVQGHINALQATSQPRPNLRSTLASRLESRMQLELTTPPVDSGFQSMNFNGLHHSPTVALREPQFMPQTSGMPHGDGLFSLSGLTSDFDTWWSGEMNAGEGRGAPSDHMDPNSHNPFEMGMGTWPPAFQRVIGGLLDPNDPGH